LQEHRQTAGKRIELRLLPDLRRLLLLPRLVASVLLFYLGEQRLHFLHLIRRFELFSGYRIYYYTKKYRDENDRKPPVMGDAIKPIYRDEYRVLKCFPHKGLLSVVLKARMLDRPPSEARGHNRPDARGGTGKSF
jgi:hypothetical protein